MKKLAITLSLVLALVIAAAVSLPALAEDLGTTTIKVSIGLNIIEVVIDEDFDVLDMGTATPQDPGTAGPMEVFIGSNAANWELRVSDQRPTGEPIPVKGYMDNGTATALTNPTEVQGGEVSAWAALTDDRTLHTATAAGSTTVTDIEFQQRVEYTDPAGDYEITVTFLGIVN